MMYETWAGGGPITTTVESQITVACSCPTSALSDTFLVLVQLHMLLGAAGSQRRVVPYAIFATIVILILLLLRSTWLGSPVRDCI
jgi:hypothetical protein